MELRRALLLFAIVLALAAIVSSLANPPVSGDRAGDEPASARPSTAPSPPTATVRTKQRMKSEIRFVVGRPRRTGTLKTGTAATVTVAGRDPGEVRIDGLGLIAEAAPVAPARLEVLSNKPGRYPVRFRAVPDSQSRLLGILQIVPAPLP